MTYTVKVSQSATCTGKPLGFFGSSTCEKYLGSKCVSRRKFYTDKFACVIDFRTIDDESVSGSGRKLIGTQAGILLEIEKEVTTTDLSRLRGCRRNN